MLLAAATGFATSFACATLLHLSRVVFVAVWTLVAGGFLWWYVRDQRITPGLQLRRRWLFGVIGGLFIGALLVQGVLRQAGSPAPQGGRLAIALGWLGLVYGTVDALVLSVVPVLAIYGTRSADTLRQPTARWRFGLAAMFASLLVTGAYHLGFPEYRGTALTQPLIGNAMITAAYLMTGNPLAAIVSHVVMHGAAVLHGIDTAVQLPPHY